MTVNFTAFVHQANKNETVNTAEASLQFSHWNHTALTIFEPIWCFYQFIAALVNLYSEEDTRATL